MKSIVWVCVSALILLMQTAYAASLPGDSVNGKRLYDAKCTGCHDTSVLSRTDRVVQSLDMDGGINAKTSIKFPLTIVMEGHDESSRAGMGSGR